MRAALFIASFLLVLGCRHVVPEGQRTFSQDFTYTEITNEPPQAVLSAFVSHWGVLTSVYLPNQAHRVTVPAVPIERVESVSFAGQVLQYRIWFHPQMDKGRKLEAAIYNQEGVPVPSPGFFGPSPKVPANHSTQPTGASRSARSASAAQWRLATAAGATR
jgi:hypothetical protein